MSVAARVRRPRAPPFLDPPGYARHRSESTLLYQLIEQHYPAFRELRAETGRPGHVQEEFEAYLKCGRLEEGFLRVRREQCHAEKLVAFSCKKRGFFPSCGARRMAETAALLAVEALPERPLRQWVLSLPHALPHQPGRPHAHPRRNRGRDADPALRLGAEPEHPLSHAVSGPDPRPHAGWPLRPAGGTRRPGDLPGLVRVGLRHRRSEPSGRGLRDLLMVPVPRSRRRRRGPPRGE